MAQKIATNLGVLGGNRFDMKFGLPGLTQESLLRCIELHGSTVIPRVRDLTPESGFSTVR